VAAGMPDAKVARVMGLASSILLDEDNPRSPSNRRISITVMTREAEERLLGPRRTEMITEQDMVPAIATPAAKQ